MARELGLEAIAEGVETSTQIAALVDAGCFAGQGWGIARACSLSEARELLLGSLLGGIATEPDRGRTVELLPLR
jgi:EAL domain-containing protein (putative c-di-GMP-specific phosphodiesterase class I)